MRRHSFSYCKPYDRHSGGFTLVEMIMSIVLIGILAAVGSNMISDSFTTTRMVNADTASQQRARYALERLAREIREVKYVGTINAGNYCITTMAAGQMVFRKFVSGTPSNTCGTGDVAITINYASPNLTLQYSDPAVTATLSDQATAFALSYFSLNADGTTAATTDNSAIRFVGIDLTVTDPNSGLPIRQHMRVALRNAL